MSNKKALGDYGERLASQYLEQKGYTIISSNWHCRFGEIDIIAKDGEVLVFVEVKTRSYDYFGAPQDLVSEKKETLLVDAANRYMEKIGHDWEIRFDIIGILMPDENRYTIKHLKDAFFPGLG